jgi:hypothetical protein
LVEVKACSEVEFGSALFPDAPSDRARKHLEHLAEWGDRGYVPHVVFAVVHGRPRFWAANHHTDPEFARTLVRLAPRLHLHAVVFQSQADGATHLVEASLPVRLPDPGPDRGHLITVNPGPEEAHWSVEVEWHPSGFERAVARAPARSSFAIRGQRDRREEFLGALAPVERTTDPRHDPRFIGAIMAWRHAVRE